MQKRERQNSLLKLIDTRRVSSQVELAAGLADQGFRVTQASVSRDLFELGVAKIDGAYVRPSQTLSEAGFGAVNFDTAGENLIVGRCSSGMASAITVQIDSLGFAEIVGTIAGDDTIFLAVKDSGAQTVVLERLADIFG